MDVQTLLSVVGSELRHLHTGKVRESFALPSKSEDHGPFRLVITTDRVSIFDFVLPCEIPFKGECLHAINVFNRRLLRLRFQNLYQDMYAFGSRLDLFVPPSLVGNVALKKRAMIVFELPMIPYKIIVRGYIEGSAWEGYQETRKVGGISLGNGLVRGAKLWSPMLTPTTKAQIGHDEAIPLAELESDVGKLPGQIAIRVYDVLAQHAADRGLVLVDTKFEMAERGPGDYVLCDEVGTMDSSRYWDFAEYSRLFPESVPQALDKEYVRAWGRTMGIHRLDPKNPDHKARVAAMTVPEEVIDATSAIYLGTVERITGKTLAAFQRDDMSIA
jgi:phosphoribosylaminoimidazole-succinocarboxamide synthase